MLVCVCLCACACVRVLVCVCAFVRVVCVLLSSGTMHCIAFPTNRYYLVDGGTIWTCGEETPQEQAARKITHEAKKVLY